MKRFVIFAVSAALLIAIAIPVVLSATVSRNSGKNVILYVNGEPVVRDEYMLFISGNRSAVTTYFKTHYNAEDQENYWATSFGGQKPIDLLKQRATSDCVKAKVELELAKSNGLIRDTSYRYMEKEYEVKNLAIRQALNTKNTVYGLTQYNMSQYYQTTIENLINQLKEKLSTSTLTVTDQDVVDYYSANLVRFTNDHKWTLGECYIPYGSDKSNAYKTALSAKAKLSGEETFSDICSQYAQDGKEIQVTLFSSNGGRNPSDSVLIGAAQSLHAGETSAVTDTGNGYAILRMIKDEKNAILDLSEIKFQIKQAVLDQKFEDWLNQKVKSASITYDTKNYASISVN